MKRVLTILLVTTLFAGCCIFTGDGRLCKTPFASDACGDTRSGYTATVVLYGDSKIAVVPISRIRANTEWRFKLRPINLSSDYEEDIYETLNVEIDGKVAETPYDPGHNDWITASGTYTGSASDKHTLILCTPSELPDDTTYKYLVEVEKVGVIDPRADVC